MRCNLIPGKDIPWIGFIRSKSAVQFTFLALRKLGFPTGLGQMVPDLLHELNFIYNRPLANDVQHSDMSMEFVPLQFETREDRLSSVSQSSRKQ